MEPVCQIITPVGMLGYGFDEHEFQAALKKLSAKNIPTAIILDSGSTDSGPIKLASGSMSCPRSSYVRDLAKLLRGVTKYKFPLLVGSCGGAGLNSHVDDLEQAVKEIAEEKYTYIRSFQHQYASLTYCLALTSSKYSRSTQTSRRTLSARDSTMAVLLAAVLLSHS